ncbi:MAG TPA: methyltransferase domain-containing protein [Vicinamibacterales bacterium]|nr:methyltransferase domain-containing protein [Vicinamibacterales bacterium]
MTDWNAARYHEISTPQQTWGRRVLERLPLEGSEVVLDIGCGTGHLTAEIAGRVPAGRVVGVDRSSAMVQQAAAWLRQRAPQAAVVLADAGALPFRRAFDAAFSGATFHWIHDHAALFRSIVTALRPGGRLVAQCGGGPNLALLYARAQRLMQEPRFARYFEDWDEPTYFADVETTRRRLSEAGFVDVEVSLEPAPTTFDAPDQFRDFIANVCLRHQGARLPRAEWQAFLRDLTVAAAADTPPFTLDYWRLNLAGKRPA